MKRVYVLGSLNMDLAIESNELPKKGQTISGSNFRTCPGGKGLNQAIAASKLGADVKMLGAIGDDSFGTQMFNTLKEYKVDVTHIKTIKNVSSGIAMIILHNKDNRIILDLGANLKLEQAHVDAFLKDAQKGDIFLTQLENDIDLVGYALKVAKQKGLKTIVNPAPSNVGLRKYTKYIDILTPNEGELEDLLRHGKTVVKPSKLEIPVIIETKGKDGYTCYRDKTSYSGKAPIVNVIDTTGAGDTFNGALAYQLSLGQPINQKTLEFALKAASYSVTKKGSSVSSPTLVELEEFYK